jgi:hypothetical protein
MQQVIGAGIGNSLVDQQERVTQIGHRSNSFQVAGRQPLPWNYFRVDRRHETRR